MSGVSVLGRLLALMASARLKCRGAMTATVLMEAGGIVLATVAPYALKLLIDRLGNGRGADPALWLSVVLFVVAWTMTTPLGALWSIPSARIRAMPPEQIGLCDIGVLCARRADMDRVQGVLSAAGIETVILQSGADDRSIPGVRIATMHRAKGLEFFAVAIPFLSETAFPPPGALRSAVDPADREDITAQYRSLLHVAATRAKQALRISWSGRLTDLVK